MRPGEPATNWQPQSPEIFPTSLTVHIINISIPLRSEQKSSFINIKMEKLPFCRVVRANAKKAALPFLKSAAVNCSVEQHTWNIKIIAKQW